MRFKLAALACLVGAVLTYPGLVFAQAVVAAAPVVVQQTQDAAWWSGLADEAITALAGFAAAAVATLAPLGFAYLRSKSKLAALFVSQTMFDKMVVAIQNQIRVEADALKERLNAPHDAQLTPTQKQTVADRVQPKIEANFKETLDHLDKKPGSQDVNEIILGRVDQALAKPTPVAIPAVMARS